MEGGHAGGVVVQELLALTKNRFAIGLVPAGPGQQVLQGQLLGLVLALGQLLEHHLALHLKLPGIQSRFKNKIQQQIEGFRRPFRRNQHMKMHIVETGGGIAAAAKGLDATIEFSRRQGVAALEHHVLEKVSHAAFVSSFGGTAGPAPKIDADQRRIRAIHLDHRDGIGQAVPNRT